MEKKEDLISRQAAIAAIHCDITVIGAANAETVARTIGEFVDRIKALPSAQPQRMRGRWIEIQAPDSYGNALYECSICHSGETHTPVVEVPFCWHCGAQMEGQDGENMR